MQAGSIFSSLRATAFELPTEEARPGEGAQSGIDGRTAAVFILGAIIIVSYQSFGRVGFFEDQLAQHIDGQRLSPMFGYLYWFVSSLVWLFLLPVAIIAMTPGMRLRDFGLGLGDWRFGMRAAAALYGIMLPVLALASFRPNFIDYYPMSDFVREEIALFADDGGFSHLSPFLIYEGFYALYFIGWEFFHRGFLTIGLSRAFGWHAILVVTIPFAILHVDKPMPEAYGAIIASVMLGWLAIRTRSSWWGLFVHAAVAVTMDVFAVLQQI